MPDKTILTFADPTWLLRVKQWWLLGVLIGLLLVGEYVGLLSPVRSIAEKLWQSLILKTNQVTYHVVIPAQTWVTWHDQTQEINTLKAQYNQSLVALTQLQSLQAENETLKELIASQSGITRPIILSAPILAYGRPLIAVGSDHGVQAGSSVLVKQTLVGVVTEVSKNQSTVTLLNQETAPQILVKTDTGVQGILKGDGKNILLTEVPIDSQLGLGQRIITQGQAGVQPNLLVGTITDVKAQPSSSVQTAVVTQLVSFFETSLVEVE